MPIDVERYKRKIRRANPRFNLVPFIDILFTLLIFLVVTSSFQGINEGASSSGKPEPGESLGPSEYYLIPVAGLTKVMVNGVDKSEYIRNSAIAVHTRVLDEGEITIRPREGLIIIQTPPGFPVDKAVKSPA
ncbi:MAG: biopolymer transporter ExbD [Methanothermobacter sp.]|nr:biopolymer transporter ExbD [Methanothermobacter sp.]